MIVSTLSLALGAAEVQVDALTGKISNDSSADVVVTPSSSASGSGITLAADKVKVNSLRVPNTVAQTAIRITSGQSLTLSTNVYLGAYAWLDVAKDATYSVTGVLKGEPAGGQVRMMANGTVDLHSFSLGGASGDVALYIGSSGIVRSTDLTDVVSIPTSASVSGVQLTIDGGTLDLGLSPLKIGANTTLNINNGGCLKAAGITKSGTTAVLQFNGGAYEVSSSGAAFSGNAYVHAGGAEIVVPSGVTATISDTGALLAAPNYGLESISLWRDLKDATFPFPPLVRMASSGLSAICEFDETTGKVMGFKVTGRGSSSMTPPVVTVVCGSQSLTSRTAATMTSNTSGGLVKSDAGTLSLDGKKTNFTGLLELRGGTTIVVDTNTVDQCAGLRLAGGVLDLQGFEWTVNDFGGTGSGSVQNGSVRVANFNLDVAKVAAGNYETLTLLNVNINADALVTLTNMDGVELDPSKDYPAYSFSGDVPATFPRVNPACPRTIAKGWDTMLKDGVVYLHYYDGSLLIYY